MQEGDQGTGFRRLRCGGGWNGSNRGQKYEEERRKDSDDIDLSALLFFFLLMLVKTKKNWCTKTLFVLVTPL